MIEAHFRLDAEDIRKRLGSLEKKTPVVIRRAGYRAAEHARTVFVKETTKKYLVRQKDVRPIFRIQKEGGKNMTTKLVATDEHKNLLHWGVGQKKAVTPQIVIDYDIQKEKRTPAIYKGRFYANSSLQKLGGDKKPFIQIAKKSGHVGLFRRVSSSSNKIEGVAAPSLPQSMATPRVMNHVSREVSEVLQERVEHEISRVLEGGG